MTAQRSGKFDWDHVPVVWSVMPYLGSIFEENTQAQIEDAVAWVKGAAPDAVQVIPESGFVVIVRLQHPSTYLAIREFAHRREDRDCALAVIDESFDVCVDIGENNPLRKGFLELTAALKRNWRHWLEWRLTRKRQPNPEWLTEIRADRRERKRGGPFEDGRN